jgi:hypothetical protein
MTEIVHIAGPEVRVNTLLRQRCAWCGQMLIDYDLARVAVPEGMDPTPAVWPVAVLVAVDGGASWLVEHEVGAPLPESSCVTTLAVAEQDSNN